MTNGRARTAAVAAYGAASVEAKSLSVGSLLEERYPFAVPRYQRAYAWEDDAVADFVADIQMLLGAPAGTASHFFGGMVCIEQMDNQRIRPLSYEVVDGQQRLATFMLALSCVAELARQLRDRALRARRQSDANSAEILRIAVEDGYLWWAEHDVSAGQTYTRPRLRLSLADDPVFQELLHGNIPSSTTRESHDLLIAARAALSEMARVYVGDSGAIRRRVERLLRLRYALLDDSHIIHVVSKDRHQAYRLFSVLNDRGKSLSDADLLRSRSLELLESFASEQEEAALLWDEMLAAPAKDIEAFFRALYPSFTARRATTDLFDDTAKHFFPAGPPSTRADARRVVQTIKSFGEELASFLLIAAGEWPFSRTGAPFVGRAWQIERLHRLVVTLKHELALPVLLAGARCLTEKAFAELVYMLEIFAFRYKNICNGHAGRPAALYYDQAKTMREAAPGSYALQPFRAALRQMLSTNANDARFKEFLAEKLRYTNTSQRPNIREFLTTIEHHREWLANSPPSSVARPKPSMTKVTHIDDATIEHIYPHNARAADRDVTLEPCKHHLGNLTYFGDQDNVAAGNKSFAAKRQRNYASSAVGMTSDLATMARWTASDVIDRENALLDAARRVFVL